MTARRVIPVFQIFLWLGFLAFAVNGLLLAADAVFPKWVTPAETVHLNGQLRKMRGRIETVAAKQQLGELGDDTPVGVLIGLSSVAMGLEIPVVEENDGLPYRYLQVASPGIALEDFLRCANLVQESELRPELIVVGMHPFFLVNPPPDDAADAVLEDSTSEDPWYVRASRKFAGRWIWSYRHHNDLIGRSDDFLLTARSHAMKWRSRTGDTTRAPQENPWVQALERDKLEHPEWLETPELFIEFFERRSRHQLEDFLKHEPESGRRLLEVLHDFKQKGSAVLVVMMPEHPLLGEHIAPEAGEVLERILRSEFTADEIPILDCRQSLPDSEFIDLAHANMEGSIRLSGIVGRWIGEQERERLSSPEPQSPTAR